MKKEYLIAFSSFYKAAYARDLLSSKYRVSVIKLPLELLKTCAYGVSVTVIGVDNIIEDTKSTQLSYSGIYIVEPVGGRPQYRKID